MLYAHVGLVKNSGIHVDYGQNTVDLYERLARESITRFGSFDILS
jgi:hypothetical protein